MVGFKKTTMNRLLKMGLVLAAVLLVMTPGVVRADILLTLVSVTPTGGDFMYTYDAMLTSGSVLHTAGGGANTGFSPSNNFFTLYDVQGLVTGSESYGGILGVGTNQMHTEPLTGVNPPGIPAPIPPDSGSILNITTYWTGADITASTAPVDLGTFSFLDTNPLGSAMLAYAGATQKLEMFPDVLANNLSQVAGPGPSGPPVVPEPATLLLLVMGLPVAGLYYRRRNQ
jgi:hypothetical protein